MSEITCTISQAFAPDLFQLRRTVSYPMAQQVRTVEICIVGIAQNFVPIFDPITIGKAGMIEAMTGDLRPTDLEGLSVLQIDKVNLGFKIVNGNRVEWRLLLGAENIG